MIWNESNKNDDGNYCKLLFELPVSLLAITLKLYNIYIIDQSFVSSRAGRDRSADRCHDTLWRGAEMSPSRCR